MTKYLVTFPSLIQKQYYSINICDFHIRTMHLDTIKVIYSSMNAQVIVLKAILKFTLK